MLNAAAITVEEELAEVLARCGFDSSPVILSPVHHSWIREWEGQTMPLSRYLKGFPHDDFFVGVGAGAFQIYEMDKQDYWFHLVGELRGDVSEKELADMIRTVTSPNVERK